jgi:endonuclease-8
VPEGDTVFLTARRLHEALAGRVVTRFELRVPKLALAKASGATVTEVVPVGKHILMRLSDGRTLRSHLRMDGSWLIGPAGGPLRGRGSDIRAVVGNEDQVASGVRVHDLDLVPSRAESELIGHLGPDLLADEFDLAEALRRFATVPERMIGEALLDQRLVAGIGNVYRSELLFLNRLDPWMPVREVAELPAVLTDAVRLLRANCATYNRSTTGWRQPGQQYFVYARRGRGCRRCGTSIRQDEQGNSSQERVLYYCPSCQNVDRRRAGPSTR